MESALQQLREIEDAVAAGDLELANAAAVKLAPLLVSEKIEDLLTFRRHIENLTIGVKTIRAERALSLKQLKNQRGGAATYQMMQNAPQTAGF